MPKPRRPRSPSPPDLLAEAASRAGISPAQQSAVRDWLAEQLVGDAYAKLGQAGQDDARVPLQRVFVDLPMGDEAPAAVAAHLPRQRFLDTLLQMAPRPLRPAAVGCADAPEPPSPPVPSLGLRSWGEIPADCAGLVLIGGPGQGKSTLVQLACQLHRAALLRGRVSRLPAKVLEVLNPFVQSGQKRGQILLPERPMLPLRVVLPEAALWLSRGKDSSLLQFIEGQASATSSKLRAESLLLLARELPVLLIFDGLDEVGAVADRQRVLAAMTALIALLGQQGTLGLVVATTRPQGYTDELSHLGLKLETRTLSPLVQAESLRYARRLLEAQVPGVDERQKRLRRLEESAQDTSASHLLRTPLQVSILCTLVGRGRAPRERWRLFSSYYETIYQREIERETYASGLLQEWKTFIDELHARVALLLMVEGEESVAVGMPRDRLAEIGGEILRVDGVVGDRRDALLAETLDAVERRLVFLVEPEPGRVGFEIRSLQEFMAARALTDGESDLVRDRLQALARSPQLRNTLLFCASRIFVERREPLRGVFGELLCPNLDDEAKDASAAVSGAGALLALEVLEEGSVHTAPEFAKALMARAFGLLDLPPGREHPRLFQVADRETTPMVLEELERRIVGDDARSAVYASSASAVTSASRAVVGDDSRSVMAAWLCLIGGVTAGIESAKQLAARHWALLPDPVGLLSLNLNFWGVHGAFWLDRIEQDSVWMRPWAIVQLDVRFLQICFSEAWLGPILAWVSVSQGRHHPYRPTLLLEQEGDLRSLRPPDEVPPAWAPWVEALRFERDPSANSLAICLYAVAERMPPEDWQSLASVASWPLAASLSAPDAASLRLVADRLLRGELGDREHWLEAQARWSAHPASLADFERLFEQAEALPWAPEALHLGAPFRASLGAVTELLHGRPSQLLTAVFERGIEQWSHIADARLRRALARTLLGLTPALPPEPPLDRARLRALLDCAPGGVLHLLPMPSCLRDDSWPVVLEFIARESAQTWYYRAEATQLIELFLSDERCAPLLRAIEFGAQVFGHAEGVREAMGRMLPALRQRSFPSPELRASAAMLRVGWEPLPAAEVDAVVGEALAASDPVFGAAMRLNDALRLGAQSTKITGAILRRAYRDLGPRGAGARLLIDALRAGLLSQRSGLTDRATWTRLGLKPPFPQVSSPQQAQPEIPASPVVLESIRLEDVRGIRLLDLQLVPPPLDHGQWLVLLGPNGSGKTSILRSLALALRDTANPGIWPEGLIAAPWVRGGGGEARVRVRVAGLPERLTRIIENGSTRFVQEPPHTSPRLFPLFAYGCRRGSALGGSDREAEAKEDNGPEIATLFDEGADMLHAETWLKILEGDVTKSQDSRRVYGAVCTALCGLLKLDRIWVQDKKLRVREPDGRELPFAALSDGYLTTAGWFLDLVARWLALAERAKVVVGDDFLSEMTGLVLLDEIDLHIHPRWQVDVIRRTRKLLPKMSFVVSTHNPLALVGSTADEIVVLERDERGEVTASRRSERPMLLTGGQLYSRYFGMRDIYPEEIGRKLEDFTLLAGNPFRSDAEQARLEEIERELLQEDIQPVMSPLPRADRPPRATGDGSPE